MRIYESCVSSEDVKFKAGADDIFFAYQEGYGPYLMDGRKEIGLIHIISGLYLGADLIIDKIVMFDNEELSEELTKEFKAKILISSRYKDSIH